MQTTAPKKKRGDARKARKETDVLKVTKQRLLTRGKGGQLSWLLCEAQAAWKYSRDDRSFDEFRRAESLLACGRRLSEAQDVDFELLMAHFKKLQGKVGEAYEWELKAGPEKVTQRRKLHAVREWIAAMLLRRALRGLTPEQVEAAMLNDCADHKPTNEAVTAYGDKVCLDAWNVPMERATAVQLDYVYLRMKSPTRGGEEVPEEVMEPRGADRGLMPIETVMRDLEAQPF